MFGFTRKTDYALVALVGLADLPLDGPARLSARQISERYGVPLPVLMGVLKNLVGGGIVRSTRGSRGGYTLARVPAGISVNDVISAIEGPVSVTTCCDPEPSTAAPADPANGCTPDCRIEIRCPISSSVRHLNQQISDYLSRVTLADLMRGDLGTIPVPVAKAHDLKFRPLPEDKR